jgi:flagellar basal body-associated protein FliL
MKKIIIIVFILACLGIVAAGIWYLQNNKKGDLLIIPPSLDNQEAASNEQSAKQTAMENNEGKLVGNSNKNAAEPLAQVLVASAVYDCAGGKAIRVRFYKGEQVKVEPGQPPVPAGSVEIHLTDANRNFDLVQTISADGGRYANSDESFVFWDKGDTILVLENGAENNYVNCKIDSSISGNSVALAKTEGVGGITVGNELKGYFEKEKYYYAIDGNEKIALILKMQKPAEIQAMWFC